MSSTDSCVIWISGEHQECGHSVTRWHALTRLSGNIPRRHKLMNEGDTRNMYLWGLSITHAVKPCIWDAQIPKPVLQLYLCNLLKKSNAPTAFEWSAGLCLLRSAYIWGFTVIPDHLSLTPDRQLISMSSSEVSIRQRTLEPLCRYRLCSCGISIFTMASMKRVFPIYGSMGCVIVIHSILITTWAWILHKFIYV